MILVNIFIGLLHFFAGVALAKFAFEHWGFWTIFVAFPIGVLVFYVSYQACVNLLGYIEIFLRRLMGKS